MSRSKTLLKNNDEISGGKLLKEVLPKDIINMTKSYYNTTKESKKLRIERARENLQNFIKERLNTFLNKYIDNGDIVGRGLLYGHYDNVGKNDDYPIVFEIDEKIKNKINKILVESINVNKVTEEIIERFYKEIETNDPYEFLKINLWNLYYIDYDQMFNTSEYDSIDDFIDRDNNFSKLLMLFLMNSYNPKYTKCDMVQYLYSQYPELFKTDIKINKTLSYVFRNNFYSDDKINKYIYKKIMQSNIKNLKIKQSADKKIIKKTIQEFHKNFAIRGICLNNEILFEYENENNENEDDENESGEDDENEDENDDDNEDDENDDDNEDENDDNEDENDDNENENDDNGDYDDDDNGDYDDDENDDHDD